MEQLTDYFLTGLVTILAVIGGFVVFYLAYRFFAQINYVKELIYLYLNETIQDVAKRRKNNIIRESLKTLIYLPFVFLAITLIGMVVLN